MVDFPSIVAVNEIFTLLRYTTAGASAGMVVPAAARTSMPCQSRRASHENELKPAVVGV